MSNLVIVESPAKAKTIQKYLGKDFEVMASMGHIRDLPKSGMSIDIKNNFEPKYIEMPEKKELISKLKAAAKKSDAVYLATDPDREGEAISWHLKTVLKLPESFSNRVTFSEITKFGVQKGMSEPRKIDYNLVEAQQARRILDRIVGYDLSKVLWKKVRSGLSAGRVQSVAVRILADREEEIRKFKTEEYWTVSAKLKAKTGPSFPSSLSLKDGKKLKINSETESKAVLKDLEGTKYIVEKVKKSKRQKSPAPPFTTSTMQQEASRKLNFQAKKTMSVAQQLYEGVDVSGYGTLGLITYMRTDSLRISEEAMSAAEKYIKEAYGEKYLPEKRRYFKSKQNAQDAHEAIRPSTPSITPSEAKSSLTLDQYKLYKLIWERFMASQMALCVQNVVNVDIKANNYTFKSQGYTTLFDGYTVLYEEGKDEAEEKSTSLPEMKENDVLSLKELKDEQHFTNPPPRYTEATLIKALEENGVGRPSTYAPTITTILSRGYVEREQKTLKPTTLGETVVNYLKQQFSDIVDVKFTAQMEDNLDAIEAGKENRVNTLDTFYKGFSKTLEEANDSQRMRVPDEKTDKICEKCGKPMVIKLGRFGKFLACSGFPECKNTKALVEEVPGFCPICGGKIVAHKSKKGKTFYGCSNYPTCSFVTWDKPLDKPCPSCGSTLFKPNFRGKKPHCLKEGCGYEEK